MPLIIVENEKQWHELRARNVGGSEIGALFDCSPWITRFSLWHEKAGKVAPSFEGDNRMELGKYLEPYIAEQLGKTLGWTIRRSKEYHLHPTITGMGCTLDFDIVDHEWGPGICETKIVFDYGDYKADWAEDRAPPNYELQVQHQLAVTGRSWAVIACMVMQTGTIMPAIVRRPVASVTEEIERKVAEFWDSVDKETPPAPTGTEGELAIMRHLWPERAPKKIIRLPDGDLNTEASLYVWASEQAAAMERQKTASKAKLLAAAEDAELLQVPGFNVEMKQDRRGSIRMAVKEAANDLTAAPVASTLNAG